MPLKIRVQLPNDRYKTGELRVMDPITGGTLYGPVPVLGRAARDDAAAHQNPDRDAVLPFGNTPLGGYKVSAILANGPGTPRDIVKYGPNGSIVLDPESGPALTAKNNGRTGLLIHGGRQTANPTPLPSHLKPTNGCIRILDGDLKRLIDFLKANQFLFPGALSVDVGAPGADGGTGEAAGEGDPPPLGGPVIP